MGVPVTVIRQNFATGVSSPAGTAIVSPQELAFNQIPGLVLWLQAGRNYNRNGNGLFRSRKRLIAKDYEPIVMSLAAGQAPTVNPTGAPGNKPSLVWGAAQSPFTCPDIILPADFSQSYSLVSLHKPDDDASCTVFGSKSIRTSTTPEGASWFGSQATKDVRFAPKYTAGAASGIIQVPATSFVGTGDWRAVILERQVVGGNTFTDRLSYGTYSDVTPGSEFNIVVGTPRTGNTDPWRTNGVVFGGCFDGTAVDTLLTSRQAFESGMCAIIMGEMTPQIRSTIRDLWRANHFPTKT